MAEQKAPRVCSNNPSTDKATTVPTNSQIKLARLSSESIVTHTPANKEKVVQVKLPNHAHFRSNNKPTVNTNQAAGTTINSMMSGSACAQLQLKSERTA